MNPIILLLGLGIGFFVTKNELKKGDDNEQGTDGHDRRSRGLHRSGRQRKTDPGYHRPGRVTQKSQLDIKGEQNELERNSDVVSGKSGNDLRGEHNRTAGDDQGESVKPKISLEKETDNEP